MASTKTQEEFVVVVNEFYEIDRSAKSEGVWIKDYSITESEGAKYLTVVLENSYDFTRSAMIDYSLSHITTSNEDITLKTGSINVKNGVINIPIKGDAIYDHSRQFKITLSNPVNAKIKEIDSVVTILDNDPKPMITIESNKTLTEGESIPVKINISGETKQNVSLDYVIEHITTSGNDISMNSGSLLFTPAEKEKTITISTTDDSLDENKESFKIKLLNPIDGTISNTELLVDVLDNDLEPSVSIANANITEGDTATSIVNLTITLNKASGRETKVLLTTRDGTATSQSDYIPLINKEIVFKEGETTKVVPLTINNDFEFEAHESFEAYIHSPTNLIISGDTANINIMNNDVIYQFNKLPIYGIIEYNDGLNGWKKVVENTDYSRLYDFRYNPTESDVLVVSRDVNIGSFDTDPSTPYYADGTHSLSDWGVASGSNKRVYTENGLTITTSLLNGDFNFLQYLGNDKGVGIGSTATSGHLMNGETVTITIDGDFLNDVRISADGLGGCYDLGSTCETKVEIKGYDANNQLISTQGGYRKATSSEFGEAFIDDYYFTGKTALKKFVVKTIPTNVGGNNGNLSSGSNTLLNMTISRSAFEDVDYQKIDVDGNSVVENIKLNINESNANTNVDLNNILSQ